MSSLGRDPPFERLNDTNYSVWAPRMRAFLGTKDPSLVGTIHADFAAMTTSSVKAAMDYKALNLIILHVSDSMVNQISTCTTAWAAWTLLQNSYMSALPSRHLQLRKQLYGLRHIPSESLTAYLARARTLC